MGVQGSDCYYYIFREVWFWWSYDRQTNRQEMRKTRSTQGRRDVPGPAETFRVSKICKSQSATPRALASRRRRIWRAPHYPADPQIWNMRKRQACKLAFLGYFSEHIVQTDITQRPKGCQKAILVAGRFQELPSSSLGIFVSCFGRHLGSDSIWAPTPIWRGPKIYLFLWRWEK